MGLRMGALLCLIGSGSVSLCRAGRACARFECAPGHPGAAAAGTRSPLRFEQAERLFERSLPPLDRELKPAKGCSCGCQFGRLRRGSDDFPQLGVQVLELGAQPCRRLSIYGVDAMGG